MSNLLNYFDKAYYINLDEDVKKKQYFEEEIKKSYVHRICKRFDAVIGKYLDIRLIPDTIITQHAKNEVLEKKQKVYGISLTYGSLACALSHYFIYKECAVATKPYLIFEDDAILDREFDHHLSGILKAIPDDYDILYLGYNEIPGFGKDKISEFISKPKGLITGLYGYILSNSGAKKLLGTIFPLNKQIDSSISDNIGKFTTYCSTQRIVGVRVDFGSKTQQKASCSNIHTYDSYDGKTKTSWDKLFA